MVKSQGNPKNTLLGSQKIAQSLCHPMLVSGSVYAPDLKIRLCLRNKNTYPLRPGIFEEVSHLVYLPTIFQSVWNNLVIPSEFPHCEKATQHILGKSSPMSNAVGFYIQKSPMLIFHGNLAKLYQIMIFHQPGVPWIFWGFSRNLSYLLGWKLVWGRYNLTR